MEISENRRNEMSIGMIFCQTMYFLYLTITEKERAMANSPERVVASPYEGIKKGRIVMIKIPKPNPVTR
jgi:hypothetical protein